MRRVATVKFRAPRTLWVRLPETYRRARSLAHRRRIAAGSGWVRIGSFRLPSNSALCKAIRSSAICRLQHFSSLPPQQQQRILNRAKTFNSLSPQQQEQVRNLNSQWKQLSPDRQRAMKTAIGDLRTMPPDEREQVLNSSRYQGFSPQEREMLRQTSKLPLAPAQPAVPRPPQN
jgi:hypothetical protein